MKKPPSWRLFCVGGLRRAEPWYRMGSNLTRSIEMNKGLEALEGPFGCVLGPFVGYMADELHANAAKGGRENWQSMSIMTALEEVNWHTAKLNAAVQLGDPELIKEHAADVANMAMMLLDVCGLIGGIQNDAG